VQCARAGHRGSIARMVRSDTCPAGATPGRAAASAVRCKRDQRRKVPRVACLPWMRHSYVGCLQLPETSSRTDLSAARSARAESAERGKFHRILNKYYLFKVAHRLPPKRDGVSDFPVADCLDAMWCRDIPRRCLLAMSLRRRWPGTSCRRCQPIWRIAGLRVIWQGRIADRADPLFVRGAQWFGLVNMYLWHRGPL